MIVAWTVGQRWWSPERHSWQERQLCDDQPSPTFWPRLSPLASAPSADIVPTTSWPGTKGKFDMPQSLSKHREIGVDQDTAMGDFDFHLLRTRVLPDRS